MANKTLFQTAAGAPLPAANTRNAAGGKAFSLPPRHALAQYAVTGCLNTTFYATADAQLDRILKLAGQVDTAFVAKAAIYCRTRGYMKDTPALLCAALATLDVPLLERVFERCIDDGRTLRNFVQIIRSGVTGRKSLGSAPRRLVRRWLEARKDEDKVFRASVGQSPSLADVVKMVHPRPANPQRAAFYGWLIGRAHDGSLLPPLGAAVRGVQGWLHPQRARRALPAAHRIGPRPRCVAGRGGKRRVANAAHEPEHLRPPRRV